MTDTNYTPEEKTYTSSVKERVKSLWPSSGNNTEARRAEKPTGGGTDPKTEKALKDAGA